MVYFFESIGLTSTDLGIRVNSRKVLGACMKKSGVPDNLFEQTCVIIDKQDKIGAEECKKELISTLGLPEEVANKVLLATTAKTLEEFAKVAECENSPEVDELAQLFALSKDYGFSD